MIILPAPCPSVPPQPDLSLGYHDFRLSLPAEKDWELRLTFEFQDGPDVSEFPFLIFRDSDGFLNYELHRDLDLLGEGSLPVKVALRFLLHCTHTHHMSMNHPWEPVQSQDCSHPSLCHSLVVADQFGGCSAWHGMDDGAVFDVRFFAVHSFLLNRSTLLRALIFGCCCRRLISTAAL